MTGSDPDTVRRVWLTFAENAASAACEAQSASSALDATQGKRLTALVQAARLLQADPMSPGEGYLAAVSGRAILTVVTAWAHPGVPAARRAQLAPLVAAAAGCLLDMLGAAPEPVSARPPRADIYG